MIGSATLERLRGIVGLRHLQRSQAEAALSRARQRLDDALERQAEGHRRLSLAEAGWSTSLEGGRFDPRTAQGWAQAVRTAHGELAEQTETVSRSEEAAAEHASDLSRRLAAEQAAERLQDLAERTRRRQREASRLSEIEDAVTRRFAR